MLGSPACLIVSRLSTQLDRHVGLLIAGFVTAKATAAIAALLGAWAASFLIGQSRAWLVAAALIVAAVMMVRGPRTKPLAEPTRSLGAMGLVLFAKQAADPARWVIFASAAALGKAQHAMLGGGFGVAFVLILCWWLNERVTAYAHHSIVRNAIGALFVLTALLIGFIGKNSI